MTYAEALMTIELLGRRKGKLYPIYLRLERLRLLFAKLEIDLTLPSIHIAGTSGKGSTSSLCAAVLQAAGYKVGLHTTPHLQTPRERLQVNCIMPSEAVFTQLVTAVYQAILWVEEEHSYGSFNSQEMLFALAAYYFRQQKIDIAVIETFMGGQYDPTNVIQPLVSVVTNVDLDHTKLLGKTVESIAFVKAGVIKPSTPFLTSATQTAVRRIFRQRCADVSAPYIQIGQENSYKSKILGLKGSILSAEVQNNLFADLHIGLLGKYQINNALVVLYIIQIIRARGWLIPDEAIRQGFTQAFIPGRLEIVESEPLIILDGAHNPAKTKALASSLKRLLRGRQAIFVFAMKKGKDLETSLRPLLPVAKKFIVTHFSERKSRSTAYIACYLRSRGIPATTRLDPKTALALARQQRRGDQYICVTGSLYLVGKLRSLWHPYRQEQPYDMIDDSAWPTTIVGEPIRASEVSRSRDER